MPTLNFYLKYRPTRKSTHLVQLVYQHKGQKLRLTTPVKVEQRQWDAKRQRVKALAPHAIELNAILEKEFYYVQQAQIQLQLEGQEPLVECLRQKLLPEQKPQARFEEAVQSFYHAKPRGANGQYGQVLTQLAAFLKGSKHSHDLKAFLPLHFEQFRAWLVKQDRYSDNTVTKYLQVAKTFLAWCAKSGFIDRFESRQFGTGKTRKPQHVALTEAELAALERLELELGSEAASARDIFCFGCYTGLRYSDISCLLPENVQEQVLDGMVCRVLRIQIVKTKEPLVVPLSDRALALLKKYDYRLPVLEPRKMNRLVKEVCQQAEINQRVQLVSYKAGERVEETNSKHKCVSTHTARRTFATLSWVKGMSLPTLQRILGHAKIEQTMDYIKEVEGQTSREMLKTWNQVPVAV